MPDDFSAEVMREGEDTVLRIDLEHSPLYPSLEDTPTCMSMACTKLVENPGVTRIVFWQKRDYEYDFDQTQLLLEVALLQNQLVKQKELFSYQNMGAGQGNARLLDQRYTQLHEIIYSQIKSDPVYAYMQLTHFMRRETMHTESLTDPKELELENRYLSVLKFLVDSLEKTKLIILAKQYIADYKPLDRSLYRRIFSPTIKPDFMFTRLMASFPEGGEELDTYTVGNTEITIFRLPDTVQYLYHMMPPEFKLPEEKYELLDTARKIVAEHKPEKSEFVDPERLRQVFFNVGSDLIEELANYRHMRLRQKEIEELTDILVRYTVGFGLIEVLLQDEKVQDITINSPMGQSPMFIVHQEFDDCMTNIIPTVTEGESWASKLRMMSGRPLDEANPILDTEMIIPGANARVAVISPPLNPTGLAYAFRRHRDKPWTLPLFMKQKMISPLAAGVLSFLIDGSRTFLVAGTRSAGKTSLLGSFLTEIMRKYRIITIEDTLELPVSSFRKLGYNIQPMKVASAMTKGSTEIPADEGIRTTLRLGDSCLIIGEVRSVEAKALYEAMRVGALANVVAGTIHGDSPYGVFDRVVNDLEVQRTSFKATDIIVVANPIKSPDGLHRWRRVTQITEVGKFWERDPIAENGFRDLLKYNAVTDQLEPTADLINGESDIIKAIAGNVKEWSGNWDAVWDNILLRAKIKEAVVKFSDETGMPELLEAPFVIKANDEFHKISDKVKDQTGKLDSAKIFFEWNEVMRRVIRKMQADS